MRGKRGLSPVPKVSIKIHKIVYTYACIITISYVFKQHPKLASELTKFPLIPLDHRQMKKMLCKQKCTQRETRIIISTNYESI
jgi:hypothetical protein